MLVVQVIFGLCAAALALFCLYATADQLMNPWQKVAASTPVSASRLQARKPTIQHDDQPDACLPHGNGPPFRISMWHHHPRKSHTCLGANHVFLRAALCLAAALHRRDQDRDKQANVRGCVVRPSPRAGCCCIIAADMPPEKRQAPLPTPGFLLLRLLPPRLHHTLA
jgi:cytochrome P450